MTLFIEFLFGGVANFWVECLGWGVSNVIINLFDSYVNKLLSISLINLIIDQMWMNVLEE